MPVDPYCQQHPDDRPRKEMQKFLSGSGLIWKLSESSGIPKYKIQLLINHMVGLIAEEVLKGKAVHVPNLGAFRVKSPTGHEDSKGLWSVKFKPSAVLKNYITAKAGEDIDVQLTLIDATMLPQPYEITKDK